jgi:iron complex outermembrane receptor protein
MLIRHLRTGCAVALVFAFQTAIAAVDDEATVIVTASRFLEADPRIPANITVITRSDIRSTPAADLPALLRNHAGMDVRPLYGSLGVDAAVDLRGFGETANSNTVVLLDGQRLNPIDMGAISWSAIPLASIERIEIIRGAGTVLYGDRATGGVINIISDKSSSSGAAVNASAGSFGQRSLDAHVSGGSNTGHFKLFAHHAEAAGWRDNSQQDQQSLSGRAGLYLAGGEAFFDYAVYQDSSGLPGYLRSTAYRTDPRSTTTPGDRQQRDGYRLRPGIRLALNEALTFEAELAADREDQHAAYISFGSIADRSKENQSFTPRLRWRHGLGNLASETVIGIDYYDGNVTARYSTAPRQSAAQTSTALYAQNTTALPTDWTLTLGVRHQRMEQQADQAAYAPWFAPAMDGSAIRQRNAVDAGLAYRGTGWRAYGKFGTTFRFANTDELFGYDPVRFIPVFAGDLEPQHGRIGEIGGSVSSGPLRAQASLYRMTLQDEIGYDGAIGANANLDPTRRQGLEVEAGWRILDRLDARLAYARTEAEFRSGPYAGKDVPLVPRDKLTVQMTWDAGLAGRYSAVVNHVGARPYSGDFANAQSRLDGYTTLDLQAAWNLKPLTITARVLNVLDRRYAAYAGYSPWIADHYYYPADGRGLYLDIGYRFE